MERDVIITGGNATSVALRIAPTEVVHVRNGAKGWADDVSPVDTADRDVIVTVRAADIITSDGKVEDTTGNMPRKYLRASKWQEPDPNRVRAKPMMLGRSTP
jgi:hypothetical protein